MNEARPKSALREFIDSPWFNRTLAITGLLVGIFSLLTRFREPDITYTVNPIRTAVVRSGISSDLSVLYKGSVVTRDVTSVLLQVWNAGRAPVKPQMLLQPLEITVPDGVRILEAKAIRQTRPAIIDFNLGSLQGTPNGLITSFRILEHNDGAIFQIIYEGNPDADFTVKGVIEGQPQISRKEELRSNDYGDVLTSNQQFQVAGLCILLGVACLTVVIIENWRRRGSGVSMFKDMRFFFFVSCIAMSITGLIFLYLAIFVSAPLSFAS